MQIATTNNTHLRLAVLAATGASLHPAVSARSEGRGYPGKRLLRALRLLNAFVPGKPIRIVRVLWQHIRTSPPGTPCAPIVLQTLPLVRERPAVAGSPGSEAGGGVH
jgi:hypothetical protein